MEDLCITFMVLCFIGPFILLVFNMAEGEQLQGKRAFTIYKSLGLALTSVEVIAIPVFFVSMHKLRPWCKTLADAAENEFNEQFEEFAFIQNKSDPV